VALLSVDPVPYVTIVTEWSFDHFRSSQPMTVGVPLLERSLQALAHVAVWPWHTEFTQDRAVSHRVPSLQVHEYAGHVDATLQVAPTAVPPPLEPPAEPPPVPGVVDATPRRSLHAFSQVALSP
jgi:hypothetical protein